ncbi:MAG: lysine biosynthesis protein LysW [Pyrinomonadaceae bacterium]|nr:lysine biosynthesis protein LysW [Pyrinomonadaceae bacterium]
MPSTTCPECEERIFVDANSEQGRIITCEDCDSNLELVGLDPVELDVVSQSEPGEYSDGFNIREHDEI